MASTTLEISEFEYYTTRFRIFQSASAFFCHTVSLALLLRITKRLFRANSSDVSPMLKTFFVIWIIEDLLAIPYSIVITAFWRPAYLSYYKRLSLLVAVLYESASRMLIAGGLVGTIVFLYNSHRRILSRFGPMPGPAAGHPLQVPLRQTALCLVLYPSVRRNSDCDIFLPGT